MKFGIMNLKIEMKRGVSLITVLLFMLVATIAATATYKWITSEGRSSTSRMMEREAYQSAVAGIENTRAWMTYHANEVGALIKQYQAGGGKAIKLNNRLTPWLLADQHYDVWLTGVNTGTAHNFKLKILSAGESRQGTRHSEVAIFNVDGLYRVTIPNQAANINFDKAFQGTVTNLTNSPTFESAIINGNYTGNQPTVSRQLLVTGNVTVAGPASGATGLAGADVYVKGNLSFNGNNTMGSNNNVVYVGGALNCNGGEGSIYIGGDLYVHGGVNRSNPGPAEHDCGLYVDGNMTVNGHFDGNSGKTAQKAGTDCEKNGKKLSTCVEGHFVFTENGWYEFKSNGKGAFWAGGNWYAPSRIEANCGSDCNDEGGNRISQVDGNMYKHNATGTYHDYYAVLQQRHKDGDNWVSYSPNYGLYWKGETQSGIEGSSDNTNNQTANRHRLFGLVLSSSSNLQIATALPAWNRDNDVWSNIGATYWSNYDRMLSYGQLIDPTNNKVPQAIDVISPENWFDVTHNQACNTAGFTKINATQVAAGDLNETNSINGFWGHVQDCYRYMEAHDQLYNGYLIIAFSGAAGDNMLQSSVVYPSDHEKAGEPVLDGKFVFYFADRSNPESPAFVQCTRDFFLQPTSPTSSILLYMPEGVASGKKLRSASPFAHTVVDPENGESKSEPYSYNYYIQIGGENHTSHLSNLHVNGSVVVEDGAKAEGDDGNVNLKYRASVLNDLASAGFIQETAEYTARATGNAAGAAVAGAGGNDSYYIANAPQLYITLETQYENNENLPTVNNQENLQSSFIILPRIIHLPKNPYGRLTDYFNVVNLNGSNLTKQANKITGCADIPKSSLLYDHKASPRPADLKQGYHKCVYDDANQKVPFYVHITDNSVGSAPFVNFDKAYQAMGSSMVSHVVLKYPPGSNEEFEVKVLRPASAADGSWTITKSSTATLKEGTSCEEGNTVCTFALRFNAAGSVNLFDIETSNAESGTYAFTITDCDGCQAGDPDTKTFSRQSFVTINRADIASFCSGPGASLDKCASGGEYYKAQISTEWPDCPTPDNTWVKAVGTSSGSVVNNCSVESPNAQWTCGISTDIEMRSVEEGVPAGCQAVVPTADEGNKRIQSSLEDGHDYTLYATLKAKKVVLTINFAGKNYAGKNIQVASTTRWGSETRTCTASDAGCTFDLFTGDDVTITAPNDGTFSYWKCDPTNSANCANDDPLTTTTYTIPEMSGANTITAYFNQKDQHCFFDEFDAGTVNCSADNDGNISNEYCLDYCSDKSDCYIGKGSYPSAAKWLVIGNSSDQSKIYNEDGSIAVGREHNRWKKQTTVEPVVVMSTTNSGLYGTLRAQFLIPRLDREGDESSTRVDKSGFLLRSNNDGTKAVRLVIFADADGKLKAKVCNGAACLAAVLLKDASDNSISIGATDIVTLSATISKTASSDVLTVTVVKGNYGVVEQGVASFTLKNLTGYLTMNTRSNEFVGISLADPDFKIYDIGWHSADYNADCWDYYPNVKCSYRAAYIGGIVPLNKKSAPWVGLSSWFDDKGCTPDYYYKGDDACGNSTGDDYVQCTDKYTFTSGGIHGTNETKIAKVKISNCSGTYISETNKQLLYLEEALCGSFWVGNVKNCSRNYTLYSTTKDVPKHPSTAELDYITADELFEYGTSGNFAKLRGAKITVVMNNPNGQEVEIYLRSTGATSYYGSTAHFSKSITTTAKTSVEFNVDDLSNDLGFDPENVSGVIIRNLGENTITVTSITAECDHAPSITCGDVTFANDHFEIGATVQNVEDLIGSFVITGTEKAGSGSASNVSALAHTYDCTETPSPCPTGDAQGRIVLNSGTYNPYSVSWGEVATKDYEFEVHMKYKDGTDVPSSPCNPKPSVQQAKFSAQCKWSSGATKPRVDAGAGLPQYFQYQLASCPGGGCKWEVLLGSTKLKEGTGLVNDYTSLSSDGASAINTSTAPLDAGEYTISFKNASTATSLFAECSKTFIVGSSSSVEESSSSEEPVSSSEEPVSSSEAPVSSSEVASSSSAAAVTAVCSSVSATIYSGQENIELPVTMSNLTPTGVVRSVYIASSSSALYTDPSDNNCNSNYCPDVKITAPSAGNYTYILKIGNDELCRNTMTVIDPYMSCWIEDEDGNTITNQELESGTDYVLYWQCHAANTGSFGGNYNKNGSYVGGATCSNGICSVSTSETTGGTYAYTLDIWNCQNSAGSEITACSNTVTVAASSSSEESSGSGTTYCSVTPTFIHSDCSTNQYGTNGFNTTGKICVKIHGNVGGFNCSECAGRSWRINGGSSTTSTPSITATADGYSYIDVSEGSHSWASMAFYNISCP